MQHFIEKCMSLAVLLILAIATSNFAVAGLKGTYPVSVSSTSFSGALGSARNSADTTQQIGCWSYSAGNGFCYGINSAGSSRSCTTTNAAMLTSIKSIKGDSYIRVNFSGGACTNIFVSNFSSFEPKKP